MCSIESVMYKTIYIKLLWSHCSCRIENHNGVVITNKVCPHIPMEIIVLESFFQAYIFYQKWLQRGCFFPFCRWLVIGDSRFGFACLFLHIWHKLTFFHQFQRSFDHTQIFCSSYFTMNFSKHFCHNLSKFNLLPTLTPSIFSYTLFLYPSRHTMSLHCL